LRLYGGQGFGEGFPLPMNYTKMQKKGGAENENQEPGESGGEGEIAGSSRERGGGGSIGVGEREAEKGG